MFGRVFVLGLAASLAACATSGGAPAGLEPGKFVSLSCEGGKGFQARLSEDKRSIRVRGHHGSAELAASGAGVFEGDGYRLVTQGEGATQLLHDNKVFGKGCKAA